MPIKRPTRRPVRPWLVLLVSALVTLGAAMLVHVSEIARARAGFRRESLSARDRIRSRLDAYVAMLRGAASHFATSLHLDRGEFRSYVSQLDLQWQYPGINGVSFTRRIQRFEVDAAVAAEREEGEPDFHIWPAGDRPEYHLVVFVEPLDARNRGVIGYDQFTEPRRRRAMEQARDTGLPSVTRKVTLARERDKPQKAGFVVFIPVYLTPEIPPTVEERRELLIGYATAGFRADTFFEPLFAGSPPSAVAFQVYDGSPGEPLLATEPPRGELEMTLPLELAGSAWTLRFVSPPGVGRDTWGPLVLVIGLLGSTLLFFLARTRGEARAREERDALALRASEERYRKLFENSPLPTVIYDPETLGFLDVNEAAVSHYGWSREEFLRMTLADVRLPQDVPALRAMVAAMPEGLSTAQVTHRKKDGTEISVELSSQAFAFEGRPARMVVVNDVTEKQRAEAARRKFEREEVASENRRIVEASRLKSEFLANMSHELRTPLNAILGFSEAIREGDFGPVSGDQARSLDDVLAAGRHLLHLINGILDLAQVEAGKMRFNLEPVEVRKLIDEVVATFAADLTSKNLRVEVQVEPGLVSVIADPVRLKQVLYNYLSNAIKFSHPGGDVLVRAMPEGENEFRIEVEDHGIGIQPDDLERLFVDLQQLQSGYARPYQGTGLGLALAKRIVRAQGGTVGVRSTYGKGSVFHATLPRRLQEDPARAVKRVGT
jgi:PAS domain S-box-containing protein